MIATKTQAPMGSPWHMYFCSYIITLQNLTVILCQNKLFSWSLALSLLWNIVIST